MSSFASPFSSRSTYMPTTSYALPVDARMQGVHLENRQRHRGSDQEDIHVMVRSIPARPIPEKLLTRPLPRMQKMREEYSSPEALRQQIEYVKSDRRPMISRKVNVHFQ